MFTSFSFVKFSNFDILLIMVIFYMLLCFCSKLALRLALLFRSKNCYSRPCFYILCRQKKSGRLFIRRLLVLNKRPPVLLRGRKLSRKQAKSEIMSDIIVINKYGCRTKRQDDKTTRLGFSHC